MKKLLVGITSFFLVGQSSANIYNSLYYQEGKQTNVNQIFHTEPDDEDEEDEEDDDSFWNNINKNALETNVKEVWQKLKKQPTLTEIINKTDEYLKKSYQAIKQSATNSSHFHALGLLDKAFSDLNLFNQKGFKKFFNVKPLEISNWNSRFETLTSKWEPKFIASMEYYAFNNEDSNFKQLKGIQDRVNEIERTLEEYIELSKNQKLNYENRDIATEKQLEAVINKYDITLRNLGILVASKPDLYNMKISLHVYRNYTKITNDINVKLSADLKEFINIFLENVKRRLEKLDTDLEELKDQDSKFGAYEELHKRYLDYNKEIAFLANEELFKNTPAILNEVNGKILKLKAHFNKAGTSMANAFKTHFNKINEDIKKNLKTMTSEKSWNELEKLNTEFKKAHHLFEKMKEDDSDLKLNYTDVNSSIVNVESSLKEVRFTGFDKITVKHDRLEFQVSNATWMNILGHGTMGGAVSLLIVSSVGGEMGYVRWGTKSIQIFGKTLAKSGGYVAKGIWGLAGGAIGSIIGFIAFELPFLLLKNIPTSGTGGTFYIKYAMLATVISPPSMLLAFSIATIRTFKPQEMKNLDFFDKEV